jgi:queuine/archaeosine tRNA-ribosyltransferase
MGQIRRCCERIATLLGAPSVIGIGSMVPLLKASHIGGRFRYRRDDGTLGDQVDLIADSIGMVREAFPYSMVHVFGAGGVPTVLALFAAGADSCDSAAWRIKASYGAIQLPGTSDRFLKERERSIRARRVVDMEDIAAIDDCDCSACSPTEGLARQRMLNASFSARATHNAHVLTSEISAFRAAIRAKRDPQWLVARMTATHRLSRLTGLPLPPRG